MVNTKLQTLLSRLQTHQARVRLFLLAKQIDVLVDFSHVMLKSWMNE